MTSAVYKRPWAVLAGLAVIIFIVFSPCVRLGFINFDDDTHLVNNPATGKWGAASFQLMWSQPVQRVYIPLTTLSFAIERNLVGLNPWLYHLDNVLLHIANSLLVAIIALRLNLPLGAAIFAGAIFGLHPMRVESVAWVTERKDVLCAFFYLLACYQWLKYRATLERRSWVFVHVFCALSLLAKPMAISLPFALLGLDWYMRRRINAAAFKDKMGILILCLALGWVTYQWHIRNPIDDAFKAMQLWVSSAVFYWQKFFIPFGLNPIYPIPTGNQLLLRFLVSALVLVAIFWSLWRWRGERLWALAVAFYACSIFFILRLDDRSDIHWVADRFMYIPSIALCWWLGNVFYRYWRWGVLVVFGLGVLAFQQIPVWKDSVSLWSYVLAHSPDEPLAYNNRADAYIDLKQPQKAIDDYTYLIGLLERMPSRNIISRISDGHGGETVMVKPWHLNAVEVKFNRALAYDEAGHFDKAVADFDDVIQHYPNYDAA